MSTKVGIILINYKDYAESFLAPCRDSLRLQDYPAELIRVYIIDNASTPESFVYLQTLYPEAKILARSDGNYAAANNLGFKEAAHDGCEYIVTVNMDTEMAPTWLSELVRALESNPEAGIAQSKILLYPKTEAEKAQPRINSLGNKIHFLGFGFTSAYGEADREITGYPEITGYASGCSFIIRASLLEIIGGYNEEFYMYHDDLEISLKAKLTGAKIILAPRSVIFHKYEFKRSTRMIYYMERNRYLTLLTFYPSYLLMLIGLPGVIMDIGMLFFSLLKGWFKEELKIYHYFLQFKNYDKIQAERQKIKAFQKRPFSELAKDFSGQIEFSEIANPILKYIVNPLLNIYWQLLKLII
ncbi:MAG: glycosyltransferase family 2 protein [Patescibacteria group bacterium]